MPRGRPPKVEHVRDSFISALNSASSLVNDAMKLESVRRTTSCPSLHSKQVRRVVELAFMGIVAEWEEFLEQTFVRYICGAKASGGVPNLRLGPCKSIKHAYQLISGDPDYDPLKKYITWSSPKNVREKAKLFLAGGGTYASSLATYNDALRRASDIRNRVAHSSSMARAEFKRTALILLKSNRLRQGYRAGDLLLEQPQGVANIPSAHPTYFESFKSMYGGLANSIVP